MSTFTNVLRSRAGVMSFAFQGIAEGLSGLRSRLAEAADRRRVADELSRLTDRELSDIGLTRADIPHVHTMGDYGPGMLLLRRP